MNNPPRNELRGFGSWEPPTSVGGVGYTMACETTL
jgi:hypothetical protein